MVQFALQVFDSLVNWESNWVVFFRALSRASADQLAIMKVAAILVQTMQPPLDVHWHY
jgi:hypothetical protein